MTVVITIGTLVLAALWARRNARLQTEQRARKVRLMRWRLIEAELEAHWTVSPELRFLVWEGSNATR